MEAKTSRRRLGLWSAWTVLLALTGLGLFSAPRQPVEVAAADLDGAGLVRVVWEAEDATLVLPPMERRDDPDASGQSVLRIPLDVSKHQVALGAAAFVLPMAHHGRYRLWARAWWGDGCSNSVSVDLDGQSEKVLGNDGTYARWHWVRGDVAELRPGSHRVTLVQREDGIALDQFLLVNSDAYEPESLEAPTWRLERPAPAAHEQPGPLSQVPAPAPANPAPAPPVVAAPEIHPPPAVTLAQLPPPAQPEPLLIAPRAPPEHVLEAPPAAPKASAPEERPAALPPPGRTRGTPFLAGVGGSYRDGLEAHLMALGLPYVRLRDEEMADVEALKGIDVWLASDPRPEPAAFYRTLYAFLKSGRTAVIEILPERGHPSGADPEDLFLHREAPLGDFRHPVLIADDSLYFQGVPRRRVYDARIIARGLPPSSRVPGAAIFGAQGSGAQGTPALGALLVRKVGLGKLYHLAMPAAFAAMWKERALDPYVLNILKDVAGPGPAQPYAGFHYQPRRALKVDAADDFMRQAGELGAWKVLEGAFLTTGPLDERPDAFALRGTGTACAALGTEHWADYRAMAAVKLLRGEAGVWQGAGEGRRLCFRLRDAGRAAVLALRAAGGAEEILAEAALPEEGSWRRLSLFRRGGWTQGFVDGERVLKTRAAPEPRGPGGLCVADGEALFDDFHAIDVAALSPGRDVAPGEESSERGLDRYYQRNFERFLVYAPHWILPPDPDGSGTVRPALPLFTGGGLQVDGAPAVPVPAGDEPPSLRWPADRPPTCDLALHTSGWRDYHFAARVTDWYASAGKWTTINRWSCSPDFTWYGGLGQPEAILWHKHAAAGAVAMEVLMAPRADQRYNEEQGRDLNLVLHGNGRDLTQGYLFKVLDAAGGCQILKNDKVVARAPGIGLPRGHSLHHSWFAVGASVTGKKIRLFYDRRPVLEYADGEPLTEGRAGIWTSRNKLSLARATLSFSDAGVPDE